MTNKVVMVCGVPGSGKTWVCTHLGDKYTYIAHDDHLKQIAAALLGAAKTSDKSLITECPFGERILRLKLESHGMKVMPVFIVEAPSIVQSRYLKRDGKELPLASLTRASTIINRAKEWNAPYGTSSQMLRYLEDL